MQRLRLTFGRDDRLKYISHLDMMRMWERVFRRAGIPLAYSSGFNPHSKISTAAPLAVGVTSSCEAMDVYAEGPISVSDFLKAVTDQLPAGLRAISLEEVDLAMASLPASLRYAEYEAHLDSSISAAELRARAASLLASESLPRERLRDGKIRRYDLRPLVSTIQVTDSPDFGVGVLMRLYAGPDAAGRPEEVLDELGVRFQSRSIERVGLIFAEMA